MDMTLREVFRKKSVASVFRFLLRIGAIVGVVLLLNLVGLWIFLLSTGQFSISVFTELLTIFLLVEGSLVGVAGALMFLGYSEYRIATQGVINPAIVGDQRQRWRERRLSQQKWGIAMVVVGLLLVFFGLITSMGTSL